jgi:hypothetical protein
MRRWLLGVGVCVVAVLVMAVSGISVLPALAQTPTPTPRAPQSWKSAAGSTPMATPAVVWYFPDPYTRLASWGMWRVPLWRFDLNMDGLVNVGDELALATYDVGHVDLATPVYATPTVCPTCPAGGECGPTATPVPTSTPWGGSNLTVEQGTEFVNGIHTAVILLAIVVPVLVGGLMASVFLFFKRW